MIFPAQCNAMVGGGEVPAGSPAGCDRCGGGRQVVAQHQGLGLKPNCPHENVWSMTENLPWVWEVGEVRSFAPWFLG